MSPPVSVQPRRRPPRLRLGPDAFGSKKVTTPTTDSHPSPSTMENVRQMHYMALKRRCNPLRALDTPLPGNPAALPGQQSQIQNGSATSLVASARSPLCAFVYSDAIPTDDRPIGDTPKSEAPSCSKNVDYRLTDPSRPLEVKVAGRSIFVNPEFLQNLSPMLTQFLVREMVAGKQKSVESHLDELNYNDVLQVVMALCPTELGMFPTPVTKETFPILIRMADDFTIPRLKQLCEQFVLHLPLNQSHVSVDDLVEFLSLSIKYHMTMTSRIRLLAGLLGMPPPIAIPTEASVEPLVEPLFNSAYEMYTTGRLAHAKLLDEARLKVPCSVCRTEALSEPAIPGIQPVSFVVCSCCKATLCSNCCAMPCMTLLEKFVIENFGKKRRALMRIYENGIH
ncbi:hypothetical protein DdX_11525 [Ditylenchus destructor]|uniref:BTB domain-containing protein n=1 Tax=Ditylenchus destructor TaxID=166010 RepID=A0AAD4QY66_9BILA|nr:hypothetical protein DdX_11525 [Ditylenchus destructor]